MHERPPQPALVPLERRDALLSLVLLVTLVAGAVVRVHTGVCGQCHDDAIYVLTAKAMAEGEGYRLVNLPGEPAQTKYPPLYPVLLALLWKIWPSFPENLILLQGFGIFCSAGFLVIAYLYLVRFNHASRGVAFAACLLCASYTNFVFFAVVTMSEALFGLVMVGMLWWLETAVRDPEARPGNDFLGGLLLALPFLCRSIGLLFIPLALLLLWQQGKRWRWASVGALVAAVPWLLWTVHAASDWKKDPIQGYYTDYLGWWSSFGLPAISRVISYNVLWLLTSSGSPLFEALTNLLQLQKPVGIWFAFNAIAGFTVLGVMISDVWRGRLLPTILGSYIVLVCVWPWMPHRFLIPLLPFLTVYLMRGLLLPSNQPNLKRVWPRLAVATLLVTLVTNVHLHFHLSSARHESDSPDPGQADKKYSWARTRTLLDWIETHTDRNDVIAAGADPLISLYTGRKAYYPILCPPLALFYGFPYPTEDVYAVSLKAMNLYRPRYLVMTAGFHGEDEFRDWLAILRERNPDMLRLVYEDEQDDRFTVYEITYPTDLAKKP